MLKIAICDDDVVFVSNVEEMLQSSCDIFQTKVEIDVFYDGDTFCKAIRQGIYYDLVYLDIEMPNSDGVKTAKYIRNYDSKVLIVYISSYEEYLISLFEVEPFRFLKKPLDKKKFEEVFALAYKRILENDYQFEFKFKRALYKVPINEILYFESRGRLIYIKRRDGSDHYYDKLDNVEHRLQKRGLLFLRIHKSYLVNFCAIKKMCYEEVLLIDGTKLQISDEKQNKVRTKYLSMLKEEAV